MQLRLYLLKVSTKFYIRHPSRRREDVCMSIAPSQIRTFWRITKLPNILNGKGVLISGAGHTCAGTVWKSIRQDLKSTAISAELEGFFKQNNN